MPSSRTTASTTTSKRLNNNQSSNRRLIDQAKLIRLFLFGSNRRSTSLGVHQKLQVLWLKSSTVHRRRFCSSKRIASSSRVQQPRAMASRSKFRLIFSLGSYTQLTASSSRLWFWLNLVPCSLKRALTLTTTSSSSSHLLPLFCNSWIISSNTRARATSQHPINRSYDLYLRLLIYRPTTKHSLSTSFSRTHFSWCVALSMKLMTQTIMEKLEKALKRTKKPRSWMLWTRRFIAFW